MKQKFLFFFAAFSLVLFSVTVAVRSQNPDATPAPKLDQHWHIVPDVAPVDLQRQLKILNEAGITVDQSQIVLVGDKFTIMAADYSGEE